MLKRLLYCAQGTFLICTHCLFFALLDCCIASHARRAFVLARVFFDWNAMWPFIFILAIVPLVFFWSDSIGELFPQLEAYLPAKSSKDHVSGAGQGALPAELAGAVPGRWYVSNTEKGYVAWAMSADGQYRLAVGCHPGAQAAVQLTHLSGETMPAEGLHLNYQFGLLPLTQGFYAGDRLVDSVAQFHDVYLQDQARAVLAQFTLPGVESNSVARSVSGTCSAPPAEPTAQ